MPPAQQYVNGEQNRYMKTLIYGPPRSLKTTWALEAACAGFNVTILQGDPEGCAVLNNVDRFKPSTLSRINVLDVGNTLEKTVMSKTVDRILTKDPIAYYNEERKVMTNNLFLLKDSKTIWVWNRNLLNENDVIVLDSYSAYCDTIMRDYAAANEIKLEEAEKQEWDGWGWTSRKASWMLSAWLQLPCHSILIAHETLWEKKRQAVNSKGKKETIVEFSRLVPRSTSGPHALKVGEQFPDIIHFFITNGIVRLDTRINESAHCGCKGVPPSTYSYDKLSFQRLAEYYKIKPAPALTCQAMTYHTSVQSANVASGGYKPQERTTFVQKPDPLAALNKPMK